MYNENALTTRTKITISFQRHNILFFANASCSISVSYLRPLGDTPVPEAFNKATVKQKVTQPVAECVVIFKSVILAFFCA